MTVKELIAGEVAAGIPAKRIVLGGFSQGCATALAASMVLETKLGGIVGLSGYLPVDKEALPGLAATPAAATNQWTRVLMGHGTADPVVPYRWGSASAEALRGLGRDVVFRTYRGMAHSACDEELDDVERFLKEGKFEDGGI
ncbi:hypothetical protein HK405_000571, partial [Cladochytrium tenue]